MESIKGRGGPSAMEALEREGLTLNVDQRVPGKGLSMKNVPSIVGDTNS